MRAATPGATGKRLGHADRQKVFDLISVGVKRFDAAIECGCSIATVERVMAASGGRPSRRARRRPRSPRHLSLPEREEIRAGIAAGDSLRMISRRIGRAPSTVSREVGRAGGSEGYKATRAENLASIRSLRPKPSKLARSPRLRRQVQLMLQDYLSPRQISKKLEIQYPNDPEMRISPETIYQSLYVQTRGRFRKDLTAYLRTQRKRRKPQGKSNT
ncbi:MAG: IS30 family transposase, partial [Thermoleophilia bacterium]|nr:IS30 family transposase [Thermoleophilia bacterium]